MMTFEMFRRSLSEPAPPEALDIALQALWWAGRGDWEQAHATAQRQEGDPGCDWVHAYLHRQEGDLANARFWYRRAGQAVTSVAPEVEWADIAATLVTKPG